MSFVKKMKLDIILISAVLIGLGVVVLMNPDTTDDIIIDAGEVTVPAGE